MLAQVPQSGRAPAHLELAGTPAPGTKVGRAAAQQPHGPAAQAARRHAGGRCTCRGLTDHLPTSMSCKLQTSPVPARPRLAHDSCSLNQMTFRSTSCCGDAALPSRDQSTFHMLIWEGERGCGGRRQVVWYGVAWLFLWKRIERKQGEHPYCTHSRWFPSTQPAMLGFAAGVERQHMPRVARCMALPVGPCL